MKSSRLSLLAAGNWIIDYTKIVDVYPAQDALCHIFSETYSNGGSPYNLLIDLARLEAPFPLEALGFVGDDEDGELSAPIAYAIISSPDNCAPARRPYLLTDVMSLKGIGRRTFFIKGARMPCSDLSTLIRRQPCQIYLSATCSCSTARTSPILNMAPSRRGSPNRLKLPDSKQASTS